MLDFRQSLINSALRKVLIRFHCPLEVILDVRALVCGLSVEPASH